MIMIIKKGFNFKRDKYKMEAGGIEPPSGGLSQGGLVCISLIFVVVGLKTSGRVYSPTKRPSESQM